MAGGCEREVGPATHAAGAAAGGPAPTGGRDRSRAGETAFAAEGTESAAGHAAPSSDTASHDGSESSPSSVGAPEPQSSKASPGGPPTDEGADGTPRAGGRLIVVGTPIGNLGDFSPRAAKAFESADLICCEDTRVTSKVLAHVGVSRPLMRCDENVIAARAPQLVERMQAGETLAFASDAGMPGVSDPGQVLVDAALLAGVPVEVVPGPVACVTALVASGIPCEQFFFEGFLPRKEGERQRRLQRLALVPGALIFYESPHRTAATVATIARVFPQRMVALCRELTKLHEEVLRAPAPELAAALSARGDLRGEVVLVVSPPSGDEQEALERLVAGSVHALAGDGAAPASTGFQGPADARPGRGDAVRAEILAGLEAGEPVSALAKRLSQKYSLRKRVVYDLALELQQDR